MPNYSGVWDLKEQGVAVKGYRWQKTLPSAANMGVIMGGYSSSTQESRIIEYIGCVLSAKSINITYIAETVTFY